MQERFYIIIHDNAGNENKNFGNGVREMRHIPYNKKQEHAMELSDSKAPFYGFSKFTQPALQPHPWGIGLFYPQVSFGVRVEYVCWSTKLSCGFFYYIHKMFIKYLYNKAKTIIMSIFDAKKYHSSKGEGYG